MVWVCPRKSCLSHVENLPDPFCRHCLAELLRRQAAGLDPYTCQPLPEPTPTPTPYRHGYTDGISHAARVIGEAIAITDQRDDTPQNQLVAVREALRKLTEQ